MSMFDDLKKPFPSSEIRWRVAQCGISSQGTPWAQVLAYIDARAAMDRLDDVVGQENWKNEFRQVDGYKMCRVSIHTGSEWVYKEDGAENTDIEAEKGGLSDAFKRACVHWGIARYLYRLPATWAECSTEKQRGWNKAKTRDGKWIYWKTPNIEDFTQ